MRFVQSFLILALVFALSSCGNNETPENNEGVIDPNFKLTNAEKWFFKTVSGEGTISGVATSDDDPNPTGFIEFREDLTGYSEFSLNLLDRPYGKTENFPYERTNDRNIEVDKGDGDIETWTLLRANENVVEASWDIFFSDQFNATITTVFTPNP